MNVAKVLIVDDDTFARTALSSGLLAYGISIVGAIADARSAIELTSSANPDVVLLDLDLVLPWQEPSERERAVGRARRPRLHGAAPAHGDEAGVKSLTPPDLAALHRRLFVAPNVVLAVSGDFVPKRLRSRLEEFLAQLPKGGAPELRPLGLPLPAATGDFVEIQPREQAVVFQAFPGPAMLAPDFYVGEVADELFSGMASRLFERVREEKGLAYFVRSARVTGFESGMFCFYAGTAPATAAAVLAEIEAEIARVQSGGIEDAELMRCQVRLKAARRQGLQTIGARAMQAGLNVLYGLPANDWRNYDAYIDRVTRADLAAFDRAAYYEKRALLMQLAEDIIGHPLPGSVMNGGSLTQKRRARVGGRLAASP